MGNNFDLSDVDPLVIRYRNDVIFHNLVDRIRAAACDWRLTEPVWRDAVQLAFELERRRGRALVPAAVISNLKQKIRELRRLQTDLSIASMYSPPGNRLANHEQLMKLAAEEMALHDTIRDLSEE